MIRAKKLREISDFFRAHAVEVAVLQPTANALKKSIIDCTFPVRAYLADVGCHDYSSQGPGKKEHGKFVSSYFVGSDSLKKTKTSLYRPKTKAKNPTIGGDPRICPYGLKGYASPNDLLVLIYHQDELYIVNYSCAKVRASISEAGSPLHDLLGAASHAKDSVLDELIGKMKAICAKGFIPSMRRGDTGVGYTLETLLGIPANSSKNPDYKGIELKSSRLTADRANLFCKVPRWRDSAVNGGRELIDQYGYMEDGRKQLYCTLSAKKPNPKGFVLDPEQKWLHAFHVAKPSGTRNRVVQWHFEDLWSALKTKHPQTLWISVNARQHSGKETFRYERAAYTHTPTFLDFVSLLQSGKITVDFLMYLKDSGAVRDHGYPFKINAASISELFSAPIEFDLQK